MNNTFVEENVSYDNLNGGIPKKKIILFSFLAAGVPCIIQNLLTPLVYEIISDNISVSSSAMAGVGTLMRFLAATVRLALLIWGGYNITHSKEGAMRFAGIFMFSATIASSVMSLFDFIEMVPLAAETIAWIMLVFNVIGDILGAVISIKLFSIFEYRTENRYVTGAQLSLFRKKMVILLVIVYAMTLVTSVITAVLTSSVNTMETGQALMYAISIWGFVSGMLILFIVYLLPLKVRNIKADAIGFGGAYYISGAVISPVLLLVTGFLDMFIDAEGNNIFYMIKGGTTVLVNLITGIASLVIMFTVLKIFFPVKEEPAPEPEDRAEQILRNLIESKKNSDIEN